MCFVDKEATVNESNCTRILGSEIDTFGAKPSKMSGSSGMSGPTN